MVCGLFVKLGLWQLDRAVQAEKAQAAFQQSAALQQPISPQTEDFASGQWVYAEGFLHPEHALLLDNQVRQGRVGYRWLIPFLSDEQVWVLLDLGFIPAKNRHELPDLPTLEARQQVEGQVYHIAPHPLNDQLWAEPGVPTRIQAINLDALRSFTCLWFLMW